MSTPQKSRIPLSLQAIISRDQLADFLGLSESSMNKLIPKLPHRKLGATAIFSVQELWDHLPQKGKAE